MVSSCPSDASTPWFWVRRLREVGQAVKPAENFARRVRELRRSHTLAHARTLRSVSPLRPSLLSLFSSPRPRPRRPSAGYLSCAFPPSICVPIIGSARFRPTLTRHFRGTSQALAAKFQPRLDRGGPVFLDGPAGSVRIISGPRPRHNNSHPQQPFGYFYFSNARRPRSAS